MGTITRTFTNNIGSNGVLGSSAFNNASLNNVTSIPGVTMKLLTTATASGDASLSFTSNIDSTYDEYWFMFNNIHVSNVNTILTFMASTDGGSSYGVATTNTFVESQHNEANTIASLTYDGDKDQAQNTGLIYFGPAADIEDSASMSGIFKLYNPSSSTYVKHYTSMIQGMEHDNISTLVLGGGYINTTSPVNAIKFQMTSNTIDAGTIKLYGVS